MIPKNAKYVVPNAVTASSMLFGLLSILNSASGEFELAAWMILWAVLLDNLDGATARLLRASSEFGVQFDSFADFVAFGVAPAALIFYSTNEAGAWAGHEGLLMVCCGLYVVATAVRLARFNVTTQGESTRLFSGVSSTLVGATAAALYINWETRAWGSQLLVFFPLYCPLGAALMVSNLPFPKLRRRNNRLMNLVQILNVVTAYVVTPLRLFPPYILGLCLIYLIGGLLVCSVPAFSFGSDQGEVGASG